MKNNEKFKIIKRTGYDMFKDRRTTKYEVRQILTLFQKIQYGLFSIVTLGLFHLIPPGRNLLINPEVNMQVEGLYSDEEEAMERIENYRKGLYDNSFF